MIIEKSYCALQVKWFLSCLNDLMEIL